MTVIKKDPDKDLVILNLTDLHYGSNDEYDPDTVGKVIRYTVPELISRVKPDIITVSGDLAEESDLENYREICKYLDSFGIPWAPVMGNHDNNLSPCDMDLLGTIYASFDTCLFERGEPSLGFGNYIISVEQDGAPLSALFMMDSHNKVKVTFNGREKYVGAELTEPQLQWYSENVHRLMENGCGDTAMIFHFPPYASDEAYKAARNRGVSASDIAPRDTEGSDVWNEAYRDSFGINYNPESCCYPIDNGLLDLLVSIGSTKHVIFAHDHVNNASICHRGVRFTYGTTTGCGGYFDPRMCGGTVLTVNGDGKMSVRHEYVDVTGIIE